MFSTAGGAGEKAGREKAGQGEPASKETVDLAFGTNPPVVSGTVFTPFFLREFE